MASTRLYAKAGMVSVHIGAHIHEVAADGTVEVPHEHVDTALSLGCTRTPQAAPINPADEAAATQERIAALEVRIADLEAVVAALSEAKKK